jgi:hypothetical protein
LCDWYLVSCLRCRPLVAAEVTASATRVDELVAVVDVVLVTSGEDEALAARLFASGDAGDVRPMDTFLAALELIL